MPWFVTRTLLASALIATSLAACATSEGSAPISGFGYRITLPEPPEGVEACLRRTFPEIPDRVLTKADVVRIIGEAKLLDRSKTACGERAVSWIRDVHRDFAK